MPSVSMPSDWSLASSTPATPSFTESAVTPWVGTPAPFPEPAAAQPAAVPVEPPGALVSGDAEPELSVDETVHADAASTSSPAATAATERRTFMGSPPTMHTVRFAPGGGAGSASSPSPCAIVRRLHISHKF